MEKVHRMEKEVIGNGNGLVKTVPQLNLTVQSLSGIVNDLQTAVSGFLKYQQEQEGKSAGVQEMKRRDRWLIGILVTVIVTLATGLVYTIHLLVGA